MSIFVIGIAGGTGAGKTTLASIIRKSIGEERCIIICQDNYYKDMSHLTKEKRQSVNYDCPSAVDNELLHQHLIGLKNGNPINMPVYDFSTHTRKKKTIYVEPKDFVILEGLLILISPIILKEIDLKIYVDTPDDIRLIRRIKRDMKERNRNIDSILKQYLTSVRPMHYLHVDKEKDAADMIIKGTNINNNTIRSILAAIDNFKYFKGQVQ